jgi:hypothetical protein
MPLLLVTVSPTRVRNLGDPLVPRFQGPGRQVAVNGILVIRYGEGVELLLGPGQGLVRCHCRAQ